MGNSAFAYPAKFEAEDGQILVSFRDINWARTSAPTASEAFFMAEDCLDVAIQTLIEDGEEIPVPSKARKGETLIPVPAITAAKAALVQTMQIQHVTASQLARRMGKDAREIRRVLDPHHPTKIATLTDALGHVGMTATLTFAPAVIGQTGKEKARA